MQLFNREYLSLPQIHVLELNHMIRKILLTCNLLKIDSRQMVSIKFWMLCAFQAQTLTVSSFLHLVPNTRQSSRAPFRNGFHFVLWSWSVTLQNTLLVTGKRIHFWSAGICWVSTTCQALGQGWGHRHKSSALPFRNSQIWRERQTWKQTIPVEWDKLCTS